VNSEHRTLQQPQGTPFSRHQFQLAASATDEICRREQEDRDRKLGTKERTL
jgi:hypothetical protein